MPGGRPTQRLGTTATWRFQKQLAELQAGVDVTPSHDSLPCHIRTTVDIAVRCLNEGCRMPAGSIQQPPSLQVCQVALRHLNHAIEVVPVSLQRLAHSTMHAMLFLATDAVREAATQLGFATDDLALPATWLLPTASYAWLVKQMGWEILLLEATVLLFTPSHNMISSTHLQTPTALESDTPNNGIPAAQATISNAAGALQAGLESLHARVGAKVLQEVLAEQPFLCHPMLELLLADKQDSTPTLLQPEHTSLCGIISNVLVSSLPPGSQCSLEETIRQCRLLCLVVQQASANGGKGEPMTSAAAELYEQSAVKLEDLICHVAELLPKQEASSTMAVAHSTAHSLAEVIGQFKQLAVSLQPQTSQHSHMSTLASAILRLKCRLAFSLAGIEQSAASLVTECESMDMPAVAMSKEPSLLNQEDAPLQMLRKHGCAAFDIAINQGGQTAGQAAGLLVSQLPRLNIPAVSQHGLTPSAISKLRMLTSSSSLSPISTTPIKTASSGIPVTGPAAQPHVTPFNALNTPSASIVSIWEQHMLGFVIATLTPGLPSPWQLLAVPDVVKATGAGSYSTFCIVVALIEIASRLSTGVQPHSLNVQNGNGRQNLAASLLPFHPLLQDCVLAIAVTAMQQVTEPKQQSALLQVVNSHEQAARLLQVLSEEPTHAQGARTALVLHSNQATAQAETGQNIALSRDAEAQKVAATALSALPYAVLMPMQLLQHVLEESLKNPGQLPLQFNLLAGPLRPVALRPVKQAVITQGPGTALQDAVNGAGCDVSNPSIAEYPALVTVLKTSLQETCNSGAMNDTSLRAVLALLSRCASVGDTSTSSSLHLGSLLKITDLASGVALPLLGWCTGETRLDQARVVVTIVLHILSLGPNQAAAANASPSRTLGTGQHAWQPCLSALLQLPDGHELVLGFVAMGLTLHQQLQEAAKKGHVASSSIDQAWELLAGLVAGLQQLMSHQQDTLQPATSQLALSLLKHAVGLDATAIMVLLPLLQACLTVVAVSRVQQADDRKDVSNAAAKEEEEEDVVSAWSSKLQRILMPSTVWRPSAATAAGCLPQQMASMLRLATSHSDHTQLLVRCLHEETETQLEDAIDAVADQHGQDHAVTIEVTRCKSARESLAWVHSSLVEGNGAAAGMPASLQPTKVGVAATCIRAMQRRLGSADAVKVAQLLPEQVMDLLPSMASRQAALLLQFVIPALVASCATNEKMNQVVQDWACSVVERYTGDQSRDSPVMLSNFLTSILQPQPAGQAHAHTYTSAEQMRNLQGLPNGLLLAQGCCIHAVCQAVSTIATRIAQQPAAADDVQIQASPAMATSVESIQAYSVSQLQRCLQVLVATLSTLLPLEDAITGDGSSQSRHCPSQHTIMVSPTKPWLLAAVLLPELLSCWERLAENSTTTGVLNVAVLHILRILLQPSLVCGMTSTVSDNSLTSTGSATQDDGGGLDYSNIVHGVAMLLQGTSNKFKRMGRDDVASSFMEVLLAALQLVEEYVSKQSRADIKDNSSDAALDLNQLLGFDMEAMLLNSA